MSAGSESDAPIPKDFRKIHGWKDDLDDNALFNVIGLVTKAFPSEKSRGTDYQCLLEVHDSSSWDPSDSFGGLDVKYFHHEEGQLPKALAGDIVLIRQLKVKTYYGRRVCLSSFGTSTLVFPDGANQAWKETETKNNLLYNKYPQDKKPVIGPEEQAYVRWLKSWSNDSKCLPDKVAVPSSNRPGDSVNTTNNSRSTKGVNEGPQPPQTPGRKEKFALLQDVKDSQFCDVVVQVIKMYASGFGREIYVTDYTSNPWFYSYPEPGEQDNEEEPNFPVDPYEHLKVTTSANKNWPGPYGKSVLCVALFHPHSTADVSEGDYVSIRNLRITFDRNGHHLEGKLHSDKKYFDKIDIHRLSIQTLFDTEIGRKLEHVKLRKDSYWKELRERVPAFAALGDRGQQPPLSKSAKQKAKKRKRQAKEAEAKRAEEELTKKRRQTNANVRCAQPDLPVTSVADIIHLDRKFSHRGRECELPFINRSVKAHVRVVDFYPSALEDFCQWIESQSVNNNPTDNDDHDMQDKIHEGRWEWQFCLLVEDATVPRGTDHQDQLKLLFGPENGDFLLNLDATDLRTNKQTLAQLRELLFILWGDLEEVKQKDNYDPAHSQIHNKPFHCCIQEYGVRDRSEDGAESWIRCHRMHLTTIGVDLLGPD